LPPLADRSILVAEGTTREDVAMCEHEGFYTCVGRYDRRAGRVVYWMVCDDCHEVLRSVAEHAYEPHYVESLRFGGREPGARVSAQPA
jgi:hypothetical protein